MKRSETQALPPVVKFVLDRCRIEDDDEDGCFIWSQCTTAHGRPIARREQAYLHPQHAVFEAMVRPLGLERGKKMALVPKCNEPRCCNWKHLMPATHKTVMRLASKNGAFRRSADAVRQQVQLNRAKPHVRMTLERAREVHAAFAGGENRRQIALRLGVSYTVVWNIIAGRAWPESRPGWIVRLPYRPKKRLDKPRKNPVPSDTSTMSEAI